MLFMCLFIVQDLYAEANLAFANHVVKQNAEGISQLEEDAKKSKSANERRAIQKQIRSARLGRDILASRKQSFKNIAISDRRVIGSKPVLISGKRGESARVNVTDYLYLFSVDWRQAKTGDVLFLDFSHLTGTPNQRGMFVNDNMKVLQADGNRMTANPIEWRFGRSIGEMIPTVNDRLKIEIYDSSKYEKREGNIFIHGLWYVAKADGDSITIVMPDESEVERLAREKIAEASEKPADK